MQNISINIKKNVAGMTYSNFLAIDYVMFLNIFGLLWIF